MKQLDKGRPTQAALLLAWTEQDDLLVPALEGGRQRDEVLDGGRLPDGEKQGGRDAVVPGPMDTRGGRVCAIPRMITNVFQKIIRKFRTN